MKAVAALLALLLVPTASAQSNIDNPDESTPTTLFFHLDAHQDFPINTQPPDDKYATGSTRGVLASTTTCTPEQVPGQFHQEHHTLYGFSTPGYVEYDFEERGGPRIHPERGLAYDVLLDQSAGMTGYFYLKTTVDSASAPPEVNALPVLVPQVTVTFTIRTGDEVAFGASAYNRGDLIAQGTSAPVDLLAHDSNPTYVPQADGSHVYAIEIPIDVLDDTIPSDEDTGGYNVRIDVRTALPGCDTDLDAAFMPGLVEIYTAPDFRPRLDLAVMNPVKIEYLHPQFVGNDLLIHTSLSSPWGNYDVDEKEGGIAAIITGPTAAPSVQQVVFSQRTHEHDHHFEPVDVTWQWDYERDGAEDTVYQLELEVWNDQRTAMAVGVASINVADQTTIDGEGNLVAKVDDGEKNTPGAGALAVLGLLVAALIARRN